MEKDKKYSFEDVGYWANYIKTPIPMTRYDPIIYLNRIAENIPIGVAQLDDECLLRLAKSQKIYITDPNFFDSDEDAMWERAALFVLEQELKYRKERGV